MLGPVSIARIPAGAVEHDGNRLSDIIASLGTGELPERAISVVPSQMSVPDYDGKPHALELINFRPEAMTLSGKLDAVDVGVHVAYVTPKPGYWWAADRSREPKTISWRISGIAVDDPVVSGTVPVYDGTTQNAPITYDRDAITLTGDLTGLTAGKYRVTAKLAPGYEWRDGTADPVVLYWSIEPKIVPLPVQSKELRYTGAAQSPTFSKGDEVTVSGIQTQTDAGTYEATAYLAPSCVWPDGTTGSKRIPWSIGNKQIPRVALETASHPFTGNKITPLFSNADSSVITAGGDLYATAVGSYAATFVPVKNHEWDDGSTETIVIPWSITKVLVPLPVQSGALEYTGSSRTPTWSGYDSSLMTMQQLTTDTTSAGDKTARFTLKDPGTYQWANSSASRYVDVTWTIDKKKISRVSLSTASYTYTGRIISPSFANLNTTAVAASGTLSAMEVGEHQAIFTPNANYEWQSGGSDPITINWKVTVNTAVPVPAQKGTLTYDGNAKEPSWTGYDTALMTVAQLTTDTTSAGDKTARFTLKDPASSQWADGSGSSYVDVTWTVQKKSVAVPTQKGTLTFDGSEKVPAFNGYDASLMTMQQLTEDVTSAGSKTTRFTLKDPTNRKWTGAESSYYVDVTWTIQKGKATINPSSTYVSVLASSIASGGAKEVKVTSTSTGTVTASSSDTTVATTSVSGNTIIIAGKSAGSATISVSIAGDANCTASDSVTITVKVSAPELAKLSAEDIQAIVRAGQGPNHWKVGDTMPRTLNGPVGAQTFDNLKVQDVVVEFDHNASIEGANTMMMGLGWRDDKGTIKGFRNTGLYMNATDTTEGGWRDCLFRKSFAPQLLAAIADEDFRNIISEHTIYTSNGTKGQNNTEAEVTATRDKIYLLSEYELGTLLPLANEFEKKYQAPIWNIRNRDPYGYVSASGSLDEPLSRSPEAGSEKNFCAGNLDSSRNYGVPATSTSKRIFPVYVIA